MYTGDLIFTTVIQATNGVAIIGETISENVLRDAIQKAQGKTIFVSEDFKPDAVIGIASEFKEIPGVGFTIGGRILKSEFINGAQHVREFSLDNVSKSWDLETAGYAPIPKHITSIVASVQFAKMGLKTTICLLTIANGFEIVGTSASVYPHERVVDEQTGRKLAWKDALNKLEELDAFLRQSQDVSFVAPSLSDEQLQELKDVLSEIHKAESEQRMRLLEESLSKRGVDYSGVAKQIRRDSNPDNYVDERDSEAVPVDVDVDEDSDA